MPKRYVDGYEPPPRDWGAGAIVIFLLALIVGGLVLGSGWLVTNSFLWTADATPVATTIPGPAPRSATATASPAATATATALSMKLTEADWDVTNGHFFTQTNAEAPLATVLGFAVTNDGGIPFWDEMRRLGGPAVIGYPISQRFEWQGLDTQVFQRVILQWNAAAFQMQAVNILDELHDRGKDQWLFDVHAVPKPIPPEFDRDTGFEAVKAARLTLLSYDPAMQAYYYASPDATLLFGLPASQVTDMGTTYALRLQRGILQRWKSAQPWAKVGQVTAANAGQLAAEAGLLPPEPLRPQGAPSLPQQ